MMFQQSTRVPQSSAKALPCTYPLVRVAAAFYLDHVVHHTEHRIACAFDPAHSIDVYKALSIQALGISSNILSALPNLTESKIQIVE